MVFCTGVCCIRDPGRIRTPNPQSRNLIFYPVELLGQVFGTVVQQISKKTVELLGQVLEQQKYNIFDFYQPKLVV